MKVSLLCATEDCLSCVQQPRTDFFGFLLGNKKLGVVDTIMLQTRRLKLLFTDDESVVGKIKDFFVDILNGALN